MGRGNNTLGFYRDAGWRVCHVAIVIQGADTGSGLHTRARRVPPGLDHLDGCGVGIDCRWSRCKRSSARAKPGGEVGSSLVPVGDWSVIGQCRVYRSDPIGRTCILRKAKIVRNRLVIGFVLASRDCNQHG